MKRLAAFILLATGSVSYSVPADAQLRTNTMSQTRASGKADKKQQKAMKKYAKAQRKAQRKMLKKDRKNTKYPSHHF
jgi:hypothetical protein